METLARFLISLLNLGLVSDQRAATGWVMAGVKQAQTNNHTFQPIMISTFPESAKNWLDRASAICAVESTFRSLRPILGEREATGF